MRLQRCSPFLVLAWWVVHIAMHVVLSNAYAPDEDPWAVPDGGNGGIGSKDYGAKMWVENDPDVQMDRKKLMEEGSNGRAMVWTARQEKDELKLKTLRKHTNADFKIDYIPEKETEEAENADKHREEKIKKLERQVDKYRVKMKVTSERMSDYQMKGASLETEMAEGELKGWEKKESEVVKEIEKLKAEEQDVTAKKHGAKRLSQLAVFYSSFLRSQLKDSANPGRGLDPYNRVQ